jgi:hypothetical protein
MHGGEIMLERDIVIVAYIVSIVLAVALGYIIRGLKDAACKER